MVNKNYNPLKMWLSYVGAIIGFICQVTSCGSGNIVSGECMVWFGTWGTKYSLVGFLVGWLIHSFFRRIT